MFCWDFQKCWFISKLSLTRCCQSVFVMIGPLLRCSSAVFIIWQHDIYCSYELCYDFSVYDSLRSKFKQWLLMAVWMMNKQDGKRCTYPDRYTQNVCRHYYYYTFSLINIHISISKAVTGVASVSPLLQSLPLLLPLLEWKTNRLDILVLPSSAGIIFELHRIMVIGKMC